LYSGLGELATEFSPVVFTGEISIFRVTLLVVLVKL
jgi:hypothetical protein